MGKKIKILFLTPYAGRTGSEMMLWYLLSQLDRDKFDVFLFSRHKGELLRLLPTEISSDYSRSASSLVNRILNKIYSKLNWLTIEETQIKHIHQKFKPDVWYFNTMVMTDLVELSHRFGAKSIVHFHELESQYSGVTYGALKNCIARAFLSIGCSERVCENLRILGANRVVKQYECVDFSRIQITADKDTIKTKYQIPNGKFIVLMSGQRIERKGYDIFIDTALGLSKEDIHFVWLGSSKETGFDLYYSKKIEKLNPAGVSAFYPPQSDYFDLMNCADLFFLSSREDPFPLVMLEAAYLGKPILALNSGGSSEFINKETGMNIELSVPKIQESILTMRKDILSGKYLADEIKKHALTYDAVVQTALFENWLLRELE